MLSDVDLLKDLDSLLALQSQISITIEQIERKRDVLDEQVKTNMNILSELSKVTEKRVTVNIGEGYFVEKSLDDAQKFLNRQIEQQNETLAQFNSKLQEAMSVKGHLEQFNREGEVASSNDESFQGEKMNEEGLPYMDIVEELDDEDNVLSTKINNKAIEAPILDPEQAHSKVDLTKNDSLQTEYKYIQENANETTTKIDHDYERNIVDDDGEDQLKELLEDMELTAKTKEVSHSSLDQDDLLEKIDRLNVSPDDKFKLKQICIDEYKRLIEDENKGIENDSDQNTTLHSEVLENSLDEEKKQERNVILANIIKENNLEGTPESSGITSTSTPNEKTQVIDRNDILELELLADEFDDTDPPVNFADDEEWDFEFSDNDNGDEDDDDDDDDDVADQLLYGKSKAFLGNDSVAEKANHLLWDQILNLRLSKEKESDKHVEKQAELAKSCLRDTRQSRDDSRKSVRFSESLEINEIENISDLLKNMEEPSKISKFKQERIAFGSHKVPEDEIALKEHHASSGPVNDIFERNTEPINEEVTQAISEPTKKSRFKQKIEGKRIVEKKNNSSTLQEPINRIQLLEQSIEDNENKIIENSTPSIPDEITSDIIERITTTPDAAEMVPSVHKQSGQPLQHKATKVSRFRADKQKVKSEVIDIPVSNSNLTRVDGIIDLEKPKLDDADDDEEDVRDATLDYLSLQNDLDTMAKAYTLGMYDDDIETEGPVVNELEDFEILNRMIESMPSSDNIDTINAKKEKILGDLKRKQTEFDPKLDEIERQDEFDDDDGPILMDEIVENEFDRDDLDDTIDHDFFDQEITTNYHRLRQKIIFQNNSNGFRKTDEELEFEPIDEEGNPVRVSRFRAAKMNIQ